MSLEASSSRAIYSLVDFSYAMKLLKALADAKTMTEVIPIETINIRVEAIFNDTPCSLIFLKTNTKLPPIAFYNKFIIEHKR